MSRKSCETARVGGAISPSHGVRSDTLQLSLTALFVGSLFDSSIPTGDLTLDSYTRVDFALSWDFCEYATLIFAIDNLLNEQYEEAVGFPAPGTNPRVGLQLRY